MDKHGHRLKCPTFVLYLIVNYYGGFVKVHIDFINKYRQTALNALDSSVSVAGLTNESWGADGGAGGSGGSGYNG